MKKAIFYSIGVVVLILGLLGFAFLTGVVYDGWTNHIPHVMACFLGTIILSVLMCRLSSLGWED